MERRERQRLRLVVDERLLDTGGTLERSDGAAEIARGPLNLSLQDTGDDREQVLRRMDAESGGRRFSGLLDARQIERGEVDVALS